MKKLNVGCGKDYRSGWVNLDIINVKKDVEHNLNELPYPFKDNSFDEVLMSMVLEHLNNPIKVLKEIIRISKDKAKVRVIVPHATSYANFTDIQHKTNFTENSFNKDLMEEYELEKLVLKRKKFVFVNKWRRYFPFKRYLKVFLNGVYDDIHFEFEVSKN